VRTPHLQAATTADDADRTGQDQRRARRQLARPYAVLAKRYDKGNSMPGLLESKPPAGAGSRRQRDFAAHYAHVERLAVFAESLDIEGDRLVGVRHRVVHVVALGVQSLEIGGIDVVAPLFLGLENKLYLAGIGHWTPPLPLAYANSNAESECRLLGSDAHLRGPGRASKATFPHNYDEDAARPSRQASPINLDVTDDLVEQIAERAAQLLARQANETQDDAWLRGAEKIAAYIDCPRSRIYALVSAHRIPIHHDGSALIARRSELDQWLRRGGGRRP